MKKILTSQGKTGANIPRAFADLLEFLSVLFSDVSYKADENGYYLEIPRNDRKVVIWVALDEELTLGFADWHHHYNISDTPNSTITEFYADLNALLHNRAGVACSFDKTDKHWCGSMLLMAENLNEEYLRDEFGENKVIICNFWDSEKDKCYYL